jgi:hypothetical protein
MVMEEIQCTAHIGVLQASNLDLGGLAVDHVWLHGSLAA